MPHPLPLELVDTMCENTVCAYFNHIMNLCERGETYRAALERGDVNQLHGVWCDAYTDYLLLVDGRLTSDQLTDAYTVAISKSTSCIYRCHFSHIKPPAGAASPLRASAASAFCSHVPASSQAHAPASACEAMSTDGKSSSGLAAGAAAEAVQGAAGLLQEQQKEQEQKEQQKEPIEKEPKRQRIGTGCCVQVAPHLTFCGECWEHRTLRSRNCTCPCGSADMMIRLEPPAGDWEFCQCRSCGN